MPDLGQYALPVLLAYGVTVAILAVLVITSLRQSAKSSRILAETEARITAAKAAQTQDVPSDGL